VADVLHKIRCQVLKRRVPLESINCKLLRNDMASAELFGYKRGAFTNAIKNYSGAVTRAKDGILFLDEIHELPAETLPMLLRLMETKDYKEMGSETILNSNAQIIAATNDSEFNYRERLVKSGFINRFRCILHLPSLNHRLDDIPELAKYFYEAAVQKFQNYKLPHPDAMPIELWQKLPWNDSNIRGLKNAVYQWISEQIWDLNPDLLKNIQNAKEELCSEPRSVEEISVDDQRRKTGRPQVISNEDLYMAMKNAETSLSLREALFKYEVRSQNKTKKPFKSFKTLRQRILRIEDTKINHECLSMLNDKFAGYPDR